MADVDGALEAFQKMIQRKISPNSVSYKIVTWRLEKNRKRSWSSHIVTLHWSGCFMFFSMSIQAHLLCGPILGGTILKMWTKGLSMRESSFEFHRHSKRNSVGFGTTVKQLPMSYKHRVCAMNIFWRIGGVTAIFTFFPVGFPPILCWPCPADIIINVYFECLWELRHKTDLINGVSWFP